MQSLRLEGAEVRFNNIERAHKATLGWVSEHPVLQAWITSRSPQIVWVSGKPGSGKSTLAKFIVEQLKAQEKPKKPSTAPPIVIGIFFSDRGNEIFNSVQGFYQMVLYQLTLQQKPALFSLFPGKKEDLTGKNPMLSVDALRDSLLSIMEKEEAGSIRIIIDAFDESSEECKHTVLPFLLREFARLPSAPQILITSRAHANLGIFLHKYPTIKLNELNGNDIYEYVSDEISSYHSYHRSDDIIKRLVQKVVNRSDGVFLWVRLVAAELRKGKMIVGDLHELEAAIYSLPRDLTSFYDRILNTLDMSPESETYRIFEWVLFAARPKRVSELCCAVVMGLTTSQRPDNLKALQSKQAPAELMQARIKEYSGGLLEVKIADSVSQSVSFEFSHADADAGADQSAVERMIVQVIHQSVKEYFLAVVISKKKALGTEEESPATPLFVPGVAHAHLAKACISFLAFPDFNKEDWGYNDKVEPRKLWIYSDRHLRDHVALSEYCDTTAQLLDFRWPERKNLEIWFSYYNNSMASQGAGIVFHPLVVASRYGLVGDVKHYTSILKKDSHPRIVPDARIIIWMSLVKAASAGHLDIIELLLEADRNNEEYPGLDLPSKNKFLEHAIHDGSYGGHFKVVDRLLECWVDTNGHGENFQRLISVSLAKVLDPRSRGAREEVVELLLRRGAKLSLSCMEQSTTISWIEPPAETA